MAYCVECVEAGENLGIVTMRKVACTSIRTVFKRRIKNPDGRPLITFIRDPIDRLKSGYNFFQGTGRWQYFPPPETYRDHVDNVLAGQKNIHWDPQTDILKGLEVTPYLLEDINKVWKWFGFPELPHLNKE